MKKILIISVIVLGVILALRLSLPSVALAAGDKKEIELAQEAGQTWLDGTVASSGEPLEWVGAYLTAPQVCYDLRGKPDAYMFTIENSGEVVGYIIVGSSDYGYAMFEAADVPPPAIPSGDKVKSTLKRDLGLKVEKIGTPSRLLYLGFDNLYAVYQAGQREVAMNLKFDFAMPAANLTAAMPSPEEYKVAKKATREATPEVSASSIPTAQSTSYGYIYEDFEWGSNGNSLNASGGGVTWTVSASGNSTAVINTDYAYSGNKSGKLHGDGTHAVNAFFTCSPVQSYKFYYRCNKAGVNYHTYGDATHRIYLKIDNNGYICYQDDTGWHNMCAPGQVYVQPTYWFSLHIMINWAAHTYDILFYDPSGNLSRSESGIHMQTDGSSNGIMSFGNDGNNTFWIDNIWWGGLGRALDMTAWQRCSCAYGCCGLCWCGPSSGVSIGRYYREQKGYWNLPANCSDGLNKTDCSYDTSCYYPMYCALYDDMQTYCSACQGPTYTYNYGPGFIKMTREAGYYNFGFVDHVYTNPNDWANWYMYITSAIDHGWPTALCAKFNPELEGDEGVNFPPSKSHLIAIKGYEYPYSEAVPRAIICTDSYSGSDNLYLNWDVLGSGLFTCTITDYEVEATTVELSPAADSNPVGTTHNLTATVYDQAGIEMDGVAVTWSISGPGSFVYKDTTTDADGQADAVITSSLSGTSTVKCEVPGITPQVAAGYLHTVGLKSGGTVVAVGWNNYGQRNVGGWRDITQVAAGADHTVGLKSDGTVVAVGRNYEGQCNVGGWTDITQVATGLYHTLGLKSDGTVVAVGDNYYEQCNVGGWTDITQVATCYYHTVGLKSDGTVVAVGENYYGLCDVGGWTDIVQVAAGMYHTVGLKSDGTVVAVGRNYEGQCNVDGWTDITEVAAGSFYTVGLKSDGTVVAVGDNCYGQCNVDGWADIVQVAASYWHTVGLRFDGTVVAVGWNNDGQCNVDGWRVTVYDTATNDWTFTPEARALELSPETGENPVDTSHNLIATVYDQFGYVMEGIAVTWSISGPGSFVSQNTTTDAGGQVDAVITSSLPGTSTVKCGVLSITEVAAGSHHTVGLKSDGTVVALGNNEYGQCDVSGWTDITRVAGGLDHTVGLKSDGTVVAVGRNYEGQCDVGGWTDIVQVAAGHWHTVGLKSDGTVVAVGYSGWGQCDVGGWTDITQVAAGLYHTVGLKSDGTVVAIGNNEYGQCDVSGWTDITQVAAGPYHTVGVKTDGTVVAVGFNFYGQCNVGGWTDITQVAGGLYHTVGLKSDCTVVAVGYSSWGQCDAGGWTDITQVAAGYWHTVGVKTDGTVVAVGYNGYGQCDVDGWRVTVYDTAAIDWIIIEVDVEKYVRDSAGIWQDADSAPGPYMNIWNRPVFFKFTIYNTGSVALTSVNLTDTAMTTFYTNEACTIVASFPTTLAAGETKTYYGCLDWASGQHYDEATAVGRPPAGTSVSDSDPAYYSGILPKMDVEKYVKDNLGNWQDADSAPGPYIPSSQDPVIFKFTINNTGLVYLGDVYLLDMTNPVSSYPLYTDEDCTVEATFPTYMLVGETRTYYGKLAWRAGQQYGYAWAAAPLWSNWGIEVFDTDPTYYYGSQPSIDVEKYVKDNTGNWTDADNATGPYIPSSQNPVIFQFTIHNTGNVVLTGVNLTDTSMATFYTDEACTAEATFPTTLLAGETKTYYGELAWAAGQQDDMATAVGQPPVGSSVSDNDPAHYYGSKPSIDVEKYVKDSAGNWTDADNATGPYISKKQNPVIFKFTIHNTGNVDLTGVNLTDTHMTTFYTDEGCTTPASFPTTLAVDETNTYYGKLDWVKGQQNDTATVVGQPLVGNSVSDNDPAYYFGRG
jgi:alpha-tubulin suppressor-like RCC1 family protein